MNLKRTLLSTALMLIALVSWADVSTWTHEWNLSRAAGGEGFYHMSNNSDTIQTATLKGLEWTYQSNSSVTAFTGSMGQYFGSAKSPVIHATLKTSLLQGKILSITVETRTNNDAQTVTVGASVNGQDYGTPASVTPTYTEYKFEPTGEAQEGEIVITLDQTSETKGIIYFNKISIEYDGPGVAKPDPKDPELSFPTQVVELESGDNGAANYLNNPYKVSPITYTCSDTELAAVNSNGAIYTTGRKIGQATISAIFAGNDEYLADTASYTLIVKEKPVIPAPTVDPAGGTFTDEVTVTITSDDPLCKAIWYSTTISNVDDLGYDDGTIIVPGNVAVVTLDESCTLLAVAVGDNNVGLPATYTYDINIPLKADFGSLESANTYYTMGWDDVEEASTWKYYGINESATWTLSANSGFSNVPAFTTIDPTSKYSLSINYATTNQRERAVSPEIEIQENSKVEFYMALCGVWMSYADLKFYVNDITAGTQDQLLSAFSWCQDNEFTGPNWEQFSFDLAKYKGHKVTFEFIYEGNNGDNITIDGFKVKAESEDAQQINIVEGETVHFKDLSKGHPTAWNWTIDGGTPATSTEQNPEVKFETAGKYTVKLEVSKGEETSEITRAEYVVVTVAAPRAHIGLPEEAYYSPYAYGFVPVEVPLTYHDKSTGNPTSVKWTFEGTDIATSTDKNPVVTYETAGRYGLELNVENVTGSDRDFLVDAIQAGGSQEVWNIAPEEVENIGTIALGYYGSYGGTNWLGMKAFAERYHKPAAKAEVTGATIYFDSASTATPDSLFTVTLNRPDANGMPGEVLATATKKLSELQVSTTDVLPTVFEFEAPVEIDSEFFIVADGFPNAEPNDNVIILCTQRPVGELNTAYHLLEDEDANYNLLGTYTWFANTDSPVSFAMCANLTYTNATTGVNDINVETKSNVTSIYDVLGRKLNAPQQGINIINGKKVFVK